MSTDRKPRAKWKIFLLVILFLSFMCLRVGTVDACTIFAISKGDVVLFGNNEDYYNRSDVIYFVPPADGRYGAVYLGQRYETRYNPQGGMNEMGLAFDANALPKVRLNEHTERPQPRTWLAVMMMEDCATVEEAIEMAESYDWGSSMAYQLHLADATGEAVVIGPGADGEIAFTRIGEENYLVSTNFNLAEPGKSTESCWRYETASTMLKELRGREDLTIEDASAILEAVAMKGVEVNTVYSNVFDTKNRLVYLYYFHQFGEVVTIDLIEELEEGFHCSVIGQLFTPEIQEKARTEMRSYAKGQKESPFTLLDDELLAIGLSFSAVLVAAVFWQARYKNDTEPSDISEGSGSFDLVGFFRPNVVKVIVTLLLPAVVALLVTRKLDNVLDFYGYLLTLMMPYYDGTRITRIFNRYVLLWIPFYLAACALVYVTHMFRPRR